jgi:hypothetical protein
MPIKKQHFSQMMLTFLMLWGMLTSAQTNFVRNELANPDGFGSIIAADFNGDGNTDALNTGGTTDFLNVYQNDGQGNFTLETEINLGSHESSSANIIDYNNDGRPDILLSIEVDSNGGKVEVYRNDGNFNFTRIAEFPYTIHNADTRAIAFDYNHDGFEDIFFTNLPKNQVAINNGGTGFAAPIDTAIRGYIGGDLKKHDFNGDGYDDIIIAGTDLGDQYFEIWIGSASGGFSLGHNFFQTETGAVNHISLDDLDQDGDMDITIRAVFDTKIYENNGGFNFTRHDVSSTGLLGIGNSAVAFGDFDGDGIIDAIMQHDGAAQRYYKGLAPFVFDNSLTTSGDHHNDPLQQIFPGTERSQDPFVVLDIDKDGDLDLLSQGTNFSKAFLGLPGYTYIYLNVTNQPQQQNPIDFDGDGIHNESDFFTNNDWSIGSGINHRLDQDSDGDRAEYWDNCPDIYNPNQTDTDADGIGDACDSDPGIVELHDAIVVTSSELPNANQIEITSTQNRSLIIYYINNLGEESLQSFAIGPNNPYILQGLSDGQHRLHLSIEGTAYQDVYYNLFFNP